MENEQESMKSTVGKIEKNEILIEKQ
jgi:hypothetical protein